LPNLAGAQGQRPDGIGREAGIDPVCHTLVGAALARSGLGHRTALGTATLLIGANLPDIDVLAYLDGPAADLAFRRGWTHGIPALIVLPFLLTGAVICFDRIVRHMGRAVLPSGVLPREVLLLAVIAILTHPLLDTLNTYGVRWLMPVRGDWYYGDALFIVDPWLWLVLGLGVVASNGRRSARGLKTVGGRPARIALAVGTAYVAAMVLSGVAARRIAREELEALGGAPVDQLMVGPRPLTPFARQVVAAQGERYQVGAFRWFARPHVQGLRTFPRPRPDGPVLAAARATPLGRRFLGWARFPTVQVEEAPGGARVHLIDLRYADRPGAGFGSVTVAAASPPPASGPPPGTPLRPPRGAPAARAR
jgi:inner membrane protein